MSDFDYSDGTRTRTDRVSDSNIMQSFEEALEKALENAEAALLYSEVLPHRDAARGVEAFEMLAAAALRGLTNCQRAEVEVDDYEIEEIFEDHTGDEFEVIDENDSVKPPPPPDPELGGREITKKRRALTLEDAAEFLGCSKSEVTLKLQTGALVPVFEGRETRIPLSELERYHRQHQKTSMNVPASDEIRTAMNGLQGSRASFDDMIDQLFEDGDLVEFGDEGSDVVTPGPDSTEELKRSSTAELFKKARGED